jgi:hypothetical protein
MTRPTNYVVYPAWHQVVAANYVLLGLPWCHLMKPSAFAKAYSSECVEVKFSELRVNGVLRSSAVRPRGRGPERTFSPTSERMVDGRGGSVDRRQRGSAASPSRCSGRPGAGHDSKDARSPLCERSLFAVCAHCLPDITIGSRVKPDAPYPPSWSSPALLLPLFTQLTQKGFSTRLYGVLGSTAERPGQLRSRGGDRRLAEERGARRTLGATTRAPPRPAPGALPRSPARWGRS